MHDYWPENDDNTVYISDDIDVSDILDIIAKKWPGVSLDDITISSEYIHTQCIGYDLYDAGDYTEFVVISKN